MDWILKELFEDLERYIDENWTEKEAEALLREDDANQDQDPGYEVGRGKCR